MTRSEGLYAHRQNKDKFGFRVFDIRPHLCAEALRCAGTRAYTTIIFQRAKLTQKII